MGRPQLLYIFCGATAVGVAVLIIRVNKKQSANKHDEEVPSLDDIGRRYLTSAATRDSYTGGDKTSDGLGFTLHYDAILSPFRHKHNVRFLEVGVWYGKSLAMWCDYFTSGSCVILV
jgi:hypothetical protein